MEEEKKINLTINDGDPFFAHEMSINFNPMQFIMDFRCITPRNDPRTQGRPSLMLKHNTVMVEPWHMTLIKELMDRMIKNYEEQFGKIKKPKAMEEFEKKHKKSNDSKKGDKSTKTEAPSYFG